MQRPRHPTSGALLAGLLALAILGAGTAGGQPGADTIIFRAAGLTPGLSVEHDQDMIELRPGGLTSASFRVTNYGNEEVQVQVSLRELSANASRQPAISAYVEPRAFSLAPNETVRVEARIYTHDVESLDDRFLSFETYDQDFGGVSKYTLLPTRVVAVAEEAAPEPAPPIPAAAVAFAAAAAAVAGAAGGAALLRRREAWRYALALPWAALYTRLAPSDLLEQEKREKVYRLIEAQPGIHYSALKELTGFPAGVLVHHLRTLEKHRYIASRREGALRRFAPVRTPFPERAPPPLTPMQQRVLALLASGPLTQREIADRLGLTQQGANHHVKTLERKGHLALRMENGVWRCHALAPAADDARGEPPAAHPRVAA